jgi:ABC-type transport system involved in cytochrome c biogenesis permease subunit
LGAVAIGAAIATAILGLILGLTAQLRWTWLAALLGTCMQMTGYVAMMLDSPQPGGIEDDAAAAGLLILTMPILLAVAGLLWIGASTGFLMRRNRQRPTKAAPALGTEADFPRLPG